MEVDLKLWCWQFHGRQQGYHVILLRAQFIFIPKNCLAVKCELLHNQMIVLKARRTRHELIHLLLLVVVIIDLETTLLTRLNTPCETGAVVPIPPIDFHLHFRLGAVIWYILDLGNDLGFRVVWQDNVAICSILLDVDVQEFKCRKLPGEINWRWLGKWNDWACFGMFTKAVSTFFTLHTHTHTHTFR